MLTISLSTNGQQFDLMFQDVSKEQVWESFEFQDKNLNKFGIVAIRFDHIGTHEYFIPLILSEPQLKVQNDLDFIPITLKNCEIKKIINLVDSYNTNIETRPDSVSLGTFRLTYNNGEELTMYYIQDFKDVVNLFYELQGLIIPLENRRLSYEIASIINALTKEY